MEGLLMSGGYVGVLTLFNGKGNGFVTTASTSNNNMTPQVDCTSNGAGWVSDEFVCVCVRQLR